MLCKRSGTGAQRLLSPGDGPPSGLLHSFSSGAFPFMKTLILPNHILTLTSNGSLEIEKTRHCVLKEREDTIILRFTKEEADRIVKWFSEAPHGTMTDCT